MVTAPGRGGKADRVARRTAPAAGRAIRPPTGGERCPYVHREEPDVLTLTDTAHEVVREMVEAAGVPDGSGLRIAADGDGDGAESLSLSLASGPLEGDQVLESAGSRVFVEAAAAELLDGSVLDAQRHDDHVHFSIGLPDDGGDADDDEAG
jgi:Fe-S cluster assembly iron-binding protein IscA